MMPKRILHRKPALLHWFVFITAAAICGSVTETSAQGTAIDEAMPDTIPTDVFADWKDQDNIQGGGYVSAIEKMKNEYPEIAVTNQFISIPTRNQRSFRLRSMNIK